MQFCKSTIFWACHFFTFEMYKIKHINKTCNIYTILYHFFYIPETNCGLLHRYLLGESKLLETRSIFVPLEPDNVTKIELILTCQQGWKFITTNILLSFFLVLKGFLNSKVRGKLLRGITIRENVSKGVESFCRKHMPRLTRNHAHGFIQFQDHAMC